MNSVAQFSPWRFVTLLYELRIPGYTGFDSGLVSIDRYLSANSSFGGNSKAAVLSAALQKIVQGKPEASLTAKEGFFRVFTGQGSRQDFITAMSIINTYQSSFRAEPGLAKYFKESDFLQAMIDDCCFGLDCIGFVGTYLVDAGLLTSYEGRRPLDYTALFPPVQTLDQIRPFGVVMLTNGQHIQMIDSVGERSGSSIKLNLCQSSTGGPQQNGSVTLHDDGGGDYLPVEEFRAAAASKQYAGDQAADNAARQQQGLKPRDYESYLRSRLTKAGTHIGFRNGAIFRLSRDGEQQNPVGGSVYVGAPPNDISVGAP